MPVESLTEFLEMTGERPYRELVEHHIRRESTEQLRTAGAGESTLLPERLFPYIETYIDVLNARIGYNREFWHTATCRGAAHAIADVVAQVIPSAELLAAVEEALREEGRADVTFGLFQIATLNFAYSASSQKKQRKFMGIRKGLFR